MQKIEKVRLRDIEYFRHDNGKHHYHILVDFDLHPGECCPC